jgi:outer membrane lipoprotein-sorting protein
MKTKNSLLALLTYLLFFGNFSVKAQTDASSILGKMDEVLLSVKDKTVNVKMVLINLKSQKEKTKEAILMQKGPGMKLFRYTAPSSDSGITTLTLPNKEVYLYLPMFKKPKKITNLAESNAMNKSDFSIEEMATKPYSEEYTPELLSTSNTTYTIKLRPKDEKSSARHLVVHINKENYYPEQFDFYDKKDLMVKKSIYHHIKVNGFWVADTVSMEDLKKKHKTTLYMTDININQGLKDELFTRENMVVVDPDK